MNRILFFFLIIFTGVSTYAQINQDDIIVYLDFDNNLTDNSNNGIVFSETSNSVNPITYETGAPFTGSGSSGNFSQSVYLSTTDGFFNHANSHTIAAWLYLDQLPSIAGTNGFTILHQKDVSGQNPGRIHLEVLGATEVISSLSTNVRVSDATQVQADTWYHVASVVDKSDPDPANHTHTLYINGVMVESLTSGTESNTGSLVLGAFKNEISYTYFGNVDDLLITSQVLTPAEINNIMTNGVAAEILAQHEFTKTTNDVKIYFTNATLNYKTSTEVEEATIYSVTGQCIAKGADDNTIDLSNIASGVYVLRLQSVNGVVSKKFVLK